MNKTWHVFRTEILNHITSVSFWFGAVGIPILGFVVYGAVLYYNEQVSLGKEVPLFNTIQQSFNRIIANDEESEERLIGYTDSGGLLLRPLENYKNFVLMPIATEQQGRAAVLNEDLDAYIIISPDYIATGEIILVQRELDVFGTLDAADWIEDALTKSLLPDRNLAERLANPLQVSETIDLAPAPQRDDEELASFFLPYAVTMLLYTLVMGSSSMLLSSVSKEKENRFLEVLMTCITPMQMFLGKIWGQGVIGLFQTVVWLVSAYVLFGNSREMMGLSESFNLPPSILLWGIIFFVLGYLLYASLMAGIGAMSPNLRENSQVVFLIMLPALVPLFTLVALIEYPNGGLAFWLSLFPFTASTVMMLRLAATTVPAWQVWLSAGILLASGVIIVRMVSGLFHAQTLFSGQKVTIKSFLLALIGRA
ncbi:MAG: ABC transporter permease [Anaerolineales bacterium]